MKSYVQKGENITVTAAAATTSGDGVLIGSLFGIAAVTSEIGDDLDLVTVGVFSMAKVATDVFAVGGVVYWDDATSLVTTDDDSEANPAIGIAVTVAGNPSGSVTVRLNG